MTTASLYRFRLGGRNDENVLDANEENVRDLNDENVRDLNDGKRARRNGEFRTVIPASEPESIVQCLLNTMESPLNGFRLVGRKDEVLVTKFGY